MTAPRIRVAVALAAAALLVTVLAIGRGGEDPYRVRLLMPTAEGIRKHSDVRVGGVTVGKVKDVKVTADDRVEAHLDLDPGHSIGQGASVNILAVNLLGEKYVALDPGDAARALPSGASIPSQRITPSVDLDQVLDVLDPGTRTRLRLLLNEAGIAMAGRGTDLNRLLAEFPGGVGQATELLGQVVSDNHTLGEVVDRADSFVARLDAQREDVGRAVDAADGAAATFAARSDQLRRTLAQAPATLATLRGFLADLRRTTVPLGPAARVLAATAPKLDQTLAALPAFRRNVVPTLDQARKTAPALTRLGDQATPVVRRAVPTVTSLATFATHAQPVTKVLGSSVDGLLGVLEGWGRAIQGRDGLGHVFHGQVTLGVDALKTILDSARPAAPAARTGKQTRRRPAPGLPGALLPSGASADPKKLGAAVLGGVPAKIGKTVQGVLDAITQPKAQPTAPPSDAAALLDFLLKP